MQAQPEIQLNIKQNYQLWVVNAYFGEKLQRNCQSNALPQAQKGKTRIFKCY